MVALAGIDIEGVVHISNLVTEKTQGCQSVREPI